MSLRPYQLAAIQACRDHIRAGRRAPLIVLPTGGGKTKTASALVAGHVAKGGRVLWLAHRAELVDQAAQALTATGLTVGAIAAKTRIRPQPHASVQVASTQTLMARGSAFEPTLIVADECVPAGTDVGAGKPIEQVQVGDYVDSWNGHNRVKRRVSHVFKSPSRPLLAIHSACGRKLVCTENHPVWLENLKEFFPASKVQLHDTIRTTTGPARVKYIEALGDASSDGYVYNLEVIGTHTFFANGILTHNCHHYVSDEWSKVVGKYPDAIRIGLSATPERSDGLGLGSMFDCMVVAETIKGLTDAGYLAPLDIVAPSRPLSSKEIAQSPLDAWKEHAGGRQAVIFAPHVKAATEYAKSFELAGIPSAVVHGQLGGAERTQVMAEYAAGRTTILASVGVLTEGWDDPKTAVCIMARGCGSVGLYIQIVGRILRPHPTKDRALLIDLRGVTHVHGRPDEEREYSLDGKGIRRAGEKLGTERFCPVCQALMDPLATICGDCGRERPALEMPSVTGERLRIYAKDICANDQPHTRVARLAKWMGEAEAKGHKPGAAAFKFKACYGGRWPSSEETQKAKAILDANRRGTAA